MSFKLACRIPSIADTTSMYRAAGPLSDMRRQMDLDCYAPDKFNWASMMGADAIFLQRPYSKDDASIMEMCRRFKIPTWVDYDDFLFDIPTDNPSYWTYMKPERHKHMAFILSEATHVTVSTEALKKRLLNFNKNVTVVPNAIDLKVNDRDGLPPARNKSIAWRGSRTHHRDVFTYCQTIFRLHQKHKDWEWHFFGDSLWLLTDNMIHEKTFNHEPTDWAEYFDNIYKCAPSAMIVPLHEHGFNHCKSNIAWIESAYAGAVTIAPDWDEWKRPGVLNYRDEKEFGIHLESVMSGSLDVETIANDGWEFIKENLSLHKINKIRIDMLSSLRG